MVKGRKECDKIQLDLIDCIYLSIAGCIQETILRDFLKGIRP